jgi:single-stranded-DNA-specific exonuclease
MLTKDEAVARMLALGLDDRNQERRAIEEETVADVCRLIDSDPIFADAKALVLHDESWHPGVVGIIASRIAERYHRPAIIIGEKGKGSGRSIKGVDLHEMVSRADRSLAGFGGHAHAIGVTLGIEGVAPFREDLERVMAEAIPAHVYTPELLYDAEVDLSDLDFALVEELARLEPFGASNPHPVLRINWVALRNLRRLSGGHIKGELEGARGFISFIGFRMNIDDDLAHDMLDVLGIVEKNEWQGRISLQLRLIDYKKSPS